VDKNEISGMIIDAAMNVHTELGPGLLESVYECCLKYELLARGLTVLARLNCLLFTKAKNLMQGSE